jgi:hypothetical protein
LTRESSGEKAASGTLSARRIKRVGFKEVESLGLRVERWKIDGIDGCVVPFTRISALNIQLATSIFMPGPRAA